MSAIIFPPCSYPGYPGCPPSAGSPGPSSTAACWTWTQRHIRWSLYNFGIVLYKQYNVTMLSFIGRNNPKTLKIGFVKGHKGFCVVCSKMVKIMLRKGFFKIFLCQNSSVDANFQNYFFYLLICSLFYKYTNLTRPLLYPMFGKAALLSTLVERNQMILGFVINQWQGIMRR